MNDIPEEVRLKIATDLAKWKDDICRMVESDSNPRANSPLGVTNQILKAIIPIITKLKDAEFEKKCSECEYDPQAAEFGWFLEHGWTPPAELEAKIVQAQEDERKRITEEIKLVFHKSPTYEEFKNKYGNRPKDIVYASTLGMILGEILTALKSGKDPAKKEVIHND